MGQMKRKDRDVNGVAAKSVPDQNSNYPGVRGGHSNRVSGNMSGHGNAQGSGTANRRGNNPKTG